MEILRAPLESFASDTESDKDGDTLVEAIEKGGEGLWAGSQLGVVTGFQARSGARVTWAGGVDVFSDVFAKAEVAPYVAIMLLIFENSSLMLCYPIVDRSLETSNLSRMSRRGRFRNH